jgi:hemoglobin-like flavoprotein
MEWKDEIQRAIATSRIALLLVSSHFLASDFIINDELPEIIRQHGLYKPNEPEALRIWWVPVERITVEQLKEARLESIQAAVGSPDKPLSKKPKDREELEDAKRELSSSLIKEIRLLGDFSADARAKFKAEVTGTLASLKTAIKEELAPGEHTILYRADRADGGEVAVKALVPFVGREWMGRDFIERAKSVSHVMSATAVGIREVVDKNIKCVIMDYVNAKTLASQLIDTYRGRLPPERVVNVLAQIAKVAVDLHQMDNQHILGPVRPSHVHYELPTQKVRISLVHVANETLKSCREKPTLLLDYDALTTLIPERYLGRKIEASADQYYLGLLGLELLQGKPPVKVSSFADLEKKRRFFDAPRDYFAELPIEQPAFSFVLTRMLEQNPTKRWTSMSDLSRALSELADGKVPAAVKEFAASIYKKRMHNNRNFFDSFYRTLFASSDEIREIFSRRGMTQLEGTMDKQYQKLDKAMRYVLSFAHSKEAMVLEEQVEKHKGFGLKPEHFEFFKVAFLKALSEANITDPYSQDAWRAILNPALGFMRTEIGNEGQAQPAINIRSAGHSLDE